MFFLDMFFQLFMSVTKDDMDEITFFFLRIVWERNEERRKEEGRKERRKDGKERTRRYPLFELFTTKLGLFFIRFLYISLLFYYFIFVLMSTSTQLPYLGLFLVMRSTLPCLVYLSFRLPWVSSQKWQLGLYEIGISGIEDFVRVQINLPDLPTLPEVLLFSDKLSKRVRSAAAASRKEVRCYI